MPMAGVAHSDIVIPAALVARLAGIRRAVEVGCGNDLATAKALLAVFPRLDLLLTDVASPRGAPPHGIRHVVDDVTAPNAPLYAGADLVYGVRLPEELQRPAANVAKAVHAAFAVVPLKDELVALDDVFPRHEVFTGRRQTWHVFSSGL